MLGWVRFGNHCLKISKCRRCRTDKKADEACQAIGGHIASNFLYYIAPVYNNDTESHPSINASEITSYFNTINLQDNFEQLEKLAVNQTSLCLALSQKKSCDITLLIDLDHADAIGIKLGGVSMLTTETIYRAMFPERALCEHDRPAV